MDPIERLKYLHDQLSTQIAAEFDLLGQRMTWLLMSNSFLFTAIAVTAGHLAKEEERSVLLVVVALLIPLIGIAVSWISKSSMKVAREVIVRWKKERLKIEDKLRNELSFEFPLTIDHQYHGHAKGNKPYVALPILIMVAWGFVLVALLCDIMPPIFC